MTLKIHGQTELATNPTPDAAEVPVFYQGEVKKVTVENLRIQPVRLVYTVGSYDFNPNTYITAGYLFCEIDLLGPGGGGGAGRKGASGTARYGGDGGAGGGKSNNRFLLSQLATAYPAFSAVAAGGIGGAQQVTDDTNGQSGTTSADIGTSFYYGTAFCVMAYGGKGGAGGTASPSTAQALGGGGSVEGMCGGAARLFDYSIAESISYRYLDTDTPPGTLIKMSVGDGHQYGVFAGGGGGAGGGIDTSDVPYPGAQGGKAETSFETGSRAQGGPISTGGQSPSNFGYQTSVAAGGAGGGGADLIFGGGGGYGDNGGDTTHSGGGGGGGAAENGVGHAGAGGNGAHGLAIITIY